MRGGLGDMCLPFPRGSTFNADGLLTLTATSKHEFLGKVFTVPDEVEPEQSTWLLVLQNETGAAITVARKFVEITAGAAGRWGRVAETFPCDTAGAVALPLDDQYTVGASIAEHDYFYVVARGWCSVLTGAAVDGLATGMAVATDNAGLIGNAPAAANYYVVGTLDYLAAYSAATATRIWVSGNPLSKPPAAG